MTVDEVRDWAANHVQQGSAPVAFYMGVLDATRGMGDESCAPAGWLDESPYCEGLREGKLRLAHPEPAGRMLHGTTAGHRMLSREEREANLEALSPPPRLPEGED